MDNVNDQRPREAVKEWRIFFEESTLREGLSYVKKGYVNWFFCTEHRAKASVQVRKNGFFVEIRNAPTSLDTDWDPSCFFCDCKNKRIKRIGTGPHSRIVKTCAHEAALLRFWEKKHGPWRFRETDLEFSARMEAVRKEEKTRHNQDQKESITQQKREERERIAEERRRKQERAEEELNRRREQVRREQQEILPAQDFFPLPEDQTFFRVRRIVQHLETSRYACNRAETLLKEEAAEIEAPILTYDEVGNQVLRAEGTVQDRMGTRRVKVSVSARTVRQCTCGCQGWTAPSLAAQLCEHQLILLTKLREYIREHDPGDATDKAADALLQAMDAVYVSPPPSHRAAKERNIVLLPRIVMDGGEARLSFKLGFLGEKTLILQSDSDFLDAVENETPFPLSKLVTVDFGASDFTEDSLPWLRFLQRRVSETKAINEQLELERKSSANRYNQRTPTLSIGVRDTLTGAALDRFYELAEGTECEFQNITADFSGTIRIGQMSVRVCLKTNRMTGWDNSFDGVEVRGEMPVILRGSGGSYILNNYGLSRITREEERFLRPFQKAASGDGKIHFCVGKDHLAEFYYRLVRRLLESPFVDFEDTCAAEAKTVLSPEPAFTFRLDIEEQSIFCDVLVSYGEEKPRSMDGQVTAGEYRDTAQEERVERVLRQYFSSRIPGSPSFREKLTEDNLYRILTEGIADLEQYGTVLGSDAVRRIAVRPAPHFWVGVSIESGALNLSILSKDVDPAELLELLVSYRRKKQYHRLRSGDFITLWGNEQLESLQELTDGLEVTAEDVILHGAEMPLYRALYLDKLLESHNTLASSRDRTYQALVQNFSSIRDADYEVPEEQGGVLRPYQVYGYKWLRTLAATGFGGILADEMGLGKTLQTITLMQSLRDGGDKRPMLVVCPTSLVFNWQEEFSRFAPGLAVIPVAGTAAERKVILQEMVSRGGDAAAVYITSYDLLRKDVALYEQADFSVMVLDEAQYIKNQKAATTKAVKGIRARQRFALTGTPIENRLVELWSIFDFLMPGFLYGYTDFSRKFETPIVKNKDQSATDRLKQMTGPFILRRLKTDVLKDLPAKLEEIQYSHFEEEQRKVYDGQVVRMKQVLARSGETGQDKVKVFAELMRIRQICCDPSLLLEGYKGGSAKRESCLELIQNAIDGGHRMLVFSQFASMLSLLEGDLNRENIPFYKIIGATPKEQRLRLVRDFNDGEVPVFLISLKAGGTGLNLTGADMVIHYDPWWNLAIQNQATDRAHRIGQLRQVTVYRLIAKDTIEEKILALQEAKRDLADAVLSGESASLVSLSNEELMELLA